MSICSQPSFQIVLILLLGELTFGLAMGYPSPTIGPLTQELHLNNFHAALFSAITSICAAVGPTFANILISSGRKRSLQSISLLSIASWSLMFFNHSFFAILSRALVGLSIGSFSYLVPLFVTQISPPELKEFYSGMPQFGISSGLLIGCVIGAVSSWRVLTFCSLLPSVFLLIFAYKVPEANPVAQTNNSIPLLTYQASVFTAIKPLMVSVFFMFIQQFSGVNAVVANMDSLVGKWGSILAASAQVFSGILCIAVADRFTSQSRFAISCVFSAFSLFGLSMSTENHILGSVFAFLYLFSFGFGLAPVPWMIGGDLLPLSVREKGFSIISTSNWTFSFFVVFGFPWVQRAVGTKITLNFFALIVAFGAWFGLQRFATASYYQQNLQDDDISISPETPEAFELATDSV